LWKKSFSDIAEKSKEGHDILVGFFMVYETFIKLLEDTALSGLGDSGKTQSASGEHHL